MSLYLCYDIRGIQSFIFKIPKLKYIIGGSALIDKFDRTDVPALVKPIPGADYIFSGGGKGAFLCDNKDTVSKLKEKIIEAAHSIGLDIRFGEDEDFSQASQHADELYSFVPATGSKPCPVSGLYPVDENGREHDVIRKRMIQRGEKMFNYFEDKLITEVLHPALSGKNVEFFHNVKPEDEDGMAGCETLGNRNRWAVIAMDGNDMGSQFRHQVSKNNANRLEGEKLTEWIKKMSLALDECSAAAAKAGIQQVVSEWADTEKGRQFIAERKEVTLPVRPLVVGGDDVIVLCHSSFAMTFVKEAIRVWEETSAQNPHLWSATGGKLTISAGVLYCPVTLPLHTAIPYAEALLASAKTKGRKLNTAKENVPSPACIDWEQVTDSVIDTPAAKRQREFFFLDKEIDRVVKLTSRPYSLEEYDELEGLARLYGEGRRSKGIKPIPRTVRHRVLPALSRCSSERFAFVAEIKKNHRNLYQDLCEYEMNRSRWKEVEGAMVTDVIDALLLLEEDERMEKETA